MTNCPADSRPSIRIDPMVGVPDDVLARLGATRVTLDDVQPGILNPFRFAESRDRCTVVRDLLGVIQFCGLEHHNDSLAHRMTNPDGSVTTWRN